MTSPLERARAILRGETVPGEETGDPWPDELTVDELDAELQNLPPRDWTYGDAGDPARPAPPSADVATAEAMRAWAGRGDTTWRARAERRLVAIAHERPEFTADDLWGPDLDKPNEARALGPILLWARDQGLIVDADRFIRSTQPGNHGSPRRVWRSLVYTPPATPTETPIPNEPELDLGPTPTGDPQP